MTTTNYLNHEQSVRQSEVNNQHHHHHHNQQLSDQHRHDRYLQSRFNIDLLLINPRDHILLEQVIQLIAHCAFRETVAPEELLRHAAVNAQRRGVLVYDDDDDDDDDEDKKDDDDEKDSKDDNRNVDDDDSDVKGVNIIDE